MSGETAQQVLDTSVDSVGLSLVSSQMTAASPRSGSMYNPVVLAAGVPIHFHALQNGQYVALFRSHWITASIGTGGPQSYTDHLEAGSCWVRVAPPGGGTVSLGKIPTRFPGELVVNGAASRQDYLFTIGHQDGNGLVQHHRISEAGLLLLTGEELMPPAGGVVFDRGAYIEGEHLVVIGADADGRLFLARRQWGRIGQTDTTMRYTWEYRSAKGWLADATTLETIGISSLGPVSVARFKDRLLLSTVAQDGGAYAAKVYVARATDLFGRWKLSGDPVSLGNGPNLDPPPDPSALPDVAFAGTGTLSTVESADTYLGGTMYFQPLNTNPATPRTPGIVAQLPYVRSMLVNADGEESIDTAWGLWSITSNV